jgi:hypothetical protein
VPRPEVHVGDRWVYHHWDQLNNKLVKTYELRVTFAGPQAIHTVVKRADGSQSDAVWTADWNATVSVISEAVINPHTGLFRFPLHVGDEYESEFELAYPKGAFRAKHKYKVRVVGWEDVTVDAGSFHALKLEVRGGYERLDRDGSSFVNATVWYVPEVKRWVKYLYEDHISYPPPGRPNVGLTEELVLYRLQ